jgi:hypothetical protein
LAVECKKLFLDITYGFPVIVMRRVAAFKKKYLININSFFSSRNSSKI